MKYGISIVPYGGLTKVLGGLNTYLTKAAEITSGRSCVDDIACQFYLGRYNLWVTFNEDSGAIFGFFATEIKHYPQRRLLCIQHCVIDAGQMEPLEGLMQDIAERFAKDNGCSGIEFVGRPGWRKYAKEQGFAAQTTVFSRFFEEEKAMNKTSLRRVS